MADITELKRKRGQLKCKLSLFNKYLLEWTPPIGIRALKLRLQKIEGCYGDFETIQSAIELSDDSEAQRKERVAFENTYFEYVEKAYGIIDSLENPVPSPPPVTTFNVEPTRFVKLPEVELIKFSGQYSEWPSFADLFKAIVTNNNTLSNVQRLYYLKNSLEGPALNLIKDLPLSDANFIAAWKLLENRFANNKATIEELLGNILNTKIMKEESPNGLNKMLDHVNRNYRALTSLLTPQQLLDYLLITLIRSKCDLETQRQWLKKSSGSENVTQFLDFLQERCQVLDALENTKRNTTFKSKDNVRKAKNVLVSNTPIKSKIQIQCSLCNGSHYLNQCLKFLQMNTMQRFNFVKQAKLCINCLNKNHLVSNCQLSNCKKCNKRHHSLLHRDSFNNQNTNRTNVPSNNNKGHDIQSADLHNQHIVNTTLAHAVQENKQKVILLTTAKILVKDRQGNWVTCRSLLDNGAQAGFITQQFADRLNLDLKNTDIPVSSLNNIITKVNKCVDIQLKSRLPHNFYQTKLNCLVVPSIAGNIPSQQINNEDFNIPKGILLADPEYDIPAPIDILLNAKIFWEILQDQTLNLGRNLPVLKESKLGWLITGTCLTVEEQEESYDCHFSTTKLNKLLEKFWEIESIEESKDKVKTNSCERIYMDTTTRNKDGKYVVTLPRKIPHKELGDSLNIASKRMQTLENKFSKNPKLYHDYKLFMENYESSGHMSEVQIENMSNDIETYYLPHFAVIREQSTSTPLRVVFNGSQKTSNGISLNDTLQVGPQIQKSLFSILSRFREYNYVICGDIFQMFRHIDVTPEQRNLQRILWRSNVNEPMKTYQLNTITYGLGCSSYLAQRTLHKLYEDEGHLFPLAVQTKDQWYMDDCILGAETRKETIVLRQQITELFKKGQLRICKWVSNDKEILESIPLEDRALQDIKQFDKEGTNRILGMLWNPKKDTFSYAVDSSNMANTKRTILSKIATLWDPLGLLSPLFTEAKLIMQAIWARKLDWDDVVDSEVLKRWNNYISHLSEIENIEIPRALKIEGEILNKKIQIFADASQIAVGCAAYFCTKYKNNETTTRLIAAKNKVVPIRKPLTIPKLETEAALLASKLGKVLANVFFIKEENIEYYTDSQILLYRLHKPSKVEDLFVANRINKILEVSNPQQWHFVPTKINPADLITRPINVDKLANNNLWWEGPGEISKTPQIDDSVQEKSESFHIQKEHNAKQGKIVQYLWEKYSNLQRIVNVLAFIRRFIHNCQVSKTNNDKLVGNLSLNEINEALLIIVIKVQRENFYEEWKSLSKQKPIKSSSKLIKLNPFVDQFGILRVGGRLNQAELDYHQRHPIILPPNHTITKLLIQREHLRNLHSGPNTLLYILRQQFWILQGRRAVSSVLNKCQICFRVKPKLASQIMSDMPKDRVTPYKAFEITGTDYCGPVSVTTSNRKNAPKLKMYIVIFICLVSKAIHLDLAENLSSMTFLNVFHRFIARRGKPSVIYSDNATNYVGANRELKELLEFFQNQQNQKALEYQAILEGISWKFVAPRAPHEAGLWESMVKRIKFHLKRVMGNMVFNREQLYTLLTEIEACLNSRPLTPISEDIESLEVLTPAHFLVGGSLKSIPHPSYENIPLNRLSIWQQKERMLQSFWKKWKREYLATLQSRNKWFTKQPNIQMDQIVLIQDNNAPPLHWRLGRVIQVYYDEQEVIRHVEVKTASGVIIRSVRNLAPLPMDNIQELMIVTS